MSEIHYGRGYVYSIQYHLVWCVKYRHDVLYGQVDIDVKQFLKQIADDNNIKIIEIESDKDHIHLLIECTPQHYIPSIVKVFKGASARLLFKNILNLNNSFGVDIFGIKLLCSYCYENTEEQIRKYIQNQKKK